MLFSRVFSPYHAVLFVLLCVTCTLYVSSKNIPETDDSILGKCVMYGQCEGQYSDTPCLYSGPPKPLSQASNSETNPTEILRDLCPEFVAGGNPHVCCSTEQLIVFQEQMSMVEGLGLSRCPSCLHNFKRLMCHLTCSPHQNSYLNLTESYENDEGEKVVGELNYYVSKRYVNTMFNSCKNIQGILPGSLLMDLICGFWGSEHCTPERWVEFIGSTPAQGGFSPFRVNYILTTEDVVFTDRGGLFYPMNAPAFECSESAGPGLDKCSCEDCVESCAADDVTEQPVEESSAKQPTSSGLDQKGFADNVHQKLEKLKF